MPINGYYAMLVLIPQPSVQFERNGPHNIVHKLFYLIHLLNKFYHYEKLSIMVIIVSYCLWKDSPKIPYDSSYYMKYLSIIYYKLTHKNPVTTLIDLYPHPRLGYLVLQLPYMQLLMLFFLFQYLLLNKFQWQ